MPDKIKLDKENARSHPPENQAMIRESLEAVGPFRSIVVDGNGVLRAGEGVYTEAMKLGLKIKHVTAKPDELVAVHRPDLKGDKAQLAALYDNLAGESSTWNPEVLTQIQTAKPELIEQLWTPDQFAELLANVAPIESGDPAEPQPEVLPPFERAKELQRKWQVKTGQVWQLGPHRLICGDSTQPATLAALMGHTQAPLLHADPPYGMGKEKDGVANDNLRREKLDQFQMQWWRACRKHITDNASAYIWGNSADLWRLWYAGGLEASERLTFRNEIAWDKGWGVRRGN